MQFDDWDLNSLLMKSVTLLSKLISISLCGIDAERGGLPFSSLDLGKGWHSLSTSTCVFLLLADEFLFRRNLWTANVRGARANTSRELLLRQAVWVGVWLDLLRLAGRRGGGAGWTY